MPITVDYTPVGALSTLAKKSGQVTGQWKQADLDLQREQLRQHDRAIALQNAQTEKEFALRTQAQQFEQQQSVGNTAYNRAFAERNRSDVLTQQEFANKQVEENQVWTQSAPARELQKAIQERDLLRDNFKWEYSETQKREMAKIQEGIATIRQDNKWTPEQKQEAEKQLWSKYYGILPSKVFDDRPKANDVYEKMKIINPDGSSTVYITPGGDIKPLPDEVFKSKEEIAKTKADAVAAKAKQDLLVERAKLGIELSKAVHGITGNRLYTDEEIQTKLDKMLPLPADNTGTVPLQFTPVDTSKSFVQISPENSLKISVARQNGLINDEDLQVINQVLAQDPSKIDQILAMIEARKTRK